jgi:hypothetical protein
MKLDTVTRISLLVIAIALSVIAFRPLLFPAVGLAQTFQPAPVYIEPGVTSLRSANGDVLGKVVVDLRNGNIWGFPTLNRSPYPTSPSGPPVSSPIYLGKYDLSAMDRPPQPK